MQKDKDTPKLPDDREILRGREASPDEALWRAAGDVLKGASPVAAHDQTIFAVRELLDTCLRDPEGSLQRTILSRLDSHQPLVARHFGAPSALLRAFLEPILAQEESLAELVRVVDARWGRDYDEKPHFDRPGRPDDPDDPYTIASVHQALASCLRSLPDDA